MLGETRGSEGTIDFSENNTWHTGAYLRCTPQDEKSRTSSRQGTSGKARSKADPWLDAGVITSIGAWPVVLGEKVGTKMTQWDRIPIKHECPAVICLGTVFPTCDWWHRCKIYSKWLTSSWHKQEWEWCADWLAISLSHWLSTYLFRDRTTAVKCFCQTAVEHPENNTQGFLQTKVCHLAVCQNLVPL